jgi:hypothetical protein
MMDTNFSKKVASLGYIRWMTGWGYKQSLIRDYVHTIARPGCPKDYNLDTDVIKENPTANSLTLMPISPAFARFWHKPDHPYCKGVIDKKGFQQFCEQLHLFVGTRDQYPQFVGEYLRLSKQIDKRSGTK